MIRKNYLALTSALILLQCQICLFTLPLRINAQTFTLQDGTPVKLRINRTVSSADAKTGETVDFDVMEEVKVGENVVVPRGTIAMGGVAFAKPRGRMGKGGKLDIVLDSLRLPSGEKIPLRATKEGKGDGNGGVMTGAIVASSIVFFPAAPVFLLMKGKDITVTKGTEITAYVAGDINLDQPKSSTQSNIGTIANPFNKPKGSGSEMTVRVKSTPDGADIFIDDKFVGNTPSNISISTGDHKITIKKKGFTLWERVISVSNGSDVSINADLDKNRE